MAYVYRHIRLDKNEPFYIGIGFDDTYIRANSKHSRSTFWKNIVNKTEYRVEILIDDLTWDEACEKEKEFIALYGRRNINNGILVNMTDGGEGSHGLVHSDESKMKMSKSRSGDKNHFYGKKHTKESIKKMSYSGRGEPHYFYGKNLSQEHKDKISKANKGKKKSAEHILNMSKSQIGKKSSGEHHNAKLVLNLETGIYYDCAKDASFALNMVQSTIRGFLNGSYKNKTNLIYV
jgi:group I intron endonuclease